MADTFTASVKLQTQVQQTFDTTAGPAAGTPKVTHGNWDFAHNLSSTSTPPFSKHAAFQKALAAGAGTIDLTSLTGFNGEAVNGTGLKVQVLKLRNPSTNGNSISITPAAISGYDMLGSDFKLTLEPGDEAILFMYDTAPDIDATNKELTLAGTGTQALDVEILMG